MGRSRRETSLPACVFQRRSSFFAPFSGLRRPRSKSARLLSAKSVFDRAAHSQELASRPYVLSGLACLVDGQKRWVCRTVHRIAARAERHGCSPSRGSPAWLLRRFRSFSHPSGANERTAAQAHRWCLRALCAVGLPVRATSPSASCARPLQFMPKQLQQQVNNH